MVTPPNPFDSAAVSQYLTSKATQPEAAIPAAPAPSVELEAPPAPTPSKDVATNVEALEASVEGLEGLELTTAQEVSLMMDRWGARGVPAFLEAITHIARAVEDMGAALSNAMEEGTEVDVDTLYMAAQLGKTMESASKTMYAAGRNGLWDHLGSKPGGMTTPEGRKFKMLANTPVSRSIKYAEFQKKYPEAYADMVTERVTDQSKAGRLYLS